MTDSQARTVVAALALIIVSVIVGLVATDRVLMWFLAGAVVLIVLDRINLVGLIDEAQDTAERALGPVAPAIEREEQDEPVTEPIPVVRPDPQPATEPIEKAIDVGVARIVEDDWLADFRAELDRIERGEVEA